MRSHTSVDGRYLEAEFSARKSDKDELLQSIEASLVAVETVPCRPRIPRGRSLNSHF